MRQSGRLDEYHCDGRMKTDLTAAEKKELRQVAAHLKGAQ